MKKFVLIWSLFLSIIQGSDAFLLPDQSSDALYTLKQKIKTAKNSIILLTSSDIDASLRKAIVKQLSSDVKFKLITSSEKTAGSFAIYRNSSVFVLRSNSSHNLQTNLLVIDGKTGCLSTLGLDNVITRQQTGIILCSDQSKDIVFYQSVIDRLSLRSDPYLK